MVDREKGIAMLIRCFERQQWQPDVHPLTGVTGDNTGLRVQESSEGHDEWIPDDIQDRPPNVPQGDE